MEENQETIAYLAEPSHVSETTGTITGKTVRCYEVKATVIPSPSRYLGRSMSIEPTGKMFVLKDGNIVEKKTKAKLSKKALGWYSVPEIRTSIKNHSTWSSCLYKTPKLAIAAKVYNIMQCRNNILQKANDMINAVSDGAKPYEEINTIFQKTNPHWYI